MRSPSLVEQFKIFHRFQFFQSRRLLAQTCKRLRFVSDAVEIPAEQFVFVICKFVRSRRLSKRTVLQKSIRLFNLGGLRNPRIKILSARNFRPRFRTGKRIFQRGIRKSGERLHFKRAPVKRANDTVFAKCREGENREKSRKNFFHGKLLLFKWFRQVLSPSPKANCRARP